jgi:hypothetical protein
MDGILSTPYWSAISLSVTILALQLLGEHQKFHRVWKRFEFFDEMLSILFLE